MEGLTPSEYASMPEKLQRKCFSTVERLRFASEHQQQRQPTQSKSQPSTPQRPRTSKPDSLSSSVQTKSLSRSRGPSPNASQIYEPPLSLPQTAQSAALNILSISDEQVQWYFSLPPKARKIQFSPEEQEYYELRQKQITDALAAEEEQFLKEALEEELLPPLSPFDTQFPSTDRTVKRVRSTPSLPSLESAHTSIQSVPELTFPQPPQRRVQKPFRQPRRKMDDRFFDSIQYFSTDSVDLALDDYALPSPATPTSRSRSFSIFARPRFSLDTKPQDPRTDHSLTKPDLKSKKSYTSSKLSNTSTPEQPHTSTFKPVMKVQIPSSSPTIRATTPTPQIETPQYNDPSSRMKLRTFASAARFDEAIEFGFPSTREPTSPQSVTAPRARPPLPPIPATFRTTSVSPRPRTAAAATKMFTTSFLDPDSSRDDTEPELEHGLTTPSSDDEPSFRTIPYSNKEAASRTKPSPIQTSHEIPRPLTSHPVSPDLSHPSFAKDHDDWLTGREPTLKMTLTRRDLRENEVLDNFNIERERERRRGNGVGAGLSMMNRATDLNFGMGLNSGEEDRSRGKKGWFKRW